MGQENDLEEQKEKLQQIQHSNKRNLKRFQDPPWFSQKQGTLNLQDFAIIFL